MAFIEALENEFKRNADANIAAQQKAYLRNQFEHFGLKTPIRREIQKPFLVKAFLPSKSESELIIKTLWNKPQREYHYFAQELAFKYTKQLEKEDIALFEYMITHKSWWDTVDFIAPKIIGNYFKQFPEQKKVYVEKWLTSNTIWLQRAAIIFQLKHKQEVDTESLTSSINALLGSKEFFINKAIGWMLREYSRTNPEWVLTFVNNTPLSALSKKEALRLLKNY